MVKGVAPTPKPPYQTRHFTLNQLSRAGVLGGRRVQQRKKQRRGHSHLAVRDIHTAPRMRPRAVTLTEAPSALSLGDPAPSAEELEAALVADATQAKATTVFGFLSLPQVERPASDASMAAAMSPTSDGGGSPPALASSPPTGRLVRRASSVDLSDHKAMERKDQEMAEAHAKYAAALRAMGEFSL